MTVYHLLQAEHAKQDLARARLKVARIEDLNDPFEVLSCSLPTRADRKKFRDIRKRIHQTYGLLCFSASWDNPLLWSYYGDRHKGICLGFAVPAQSLTKVRYTAKRDDLSPDMILRPDIHRVLLSRKYRDWAYEEESRMILRLDSLLRDNDGFFKAFDEGLRLREIIVGPMCDATDAELRELLPPSVDGVQITKARMAFKSFRIVRNGY